MTYCCRFRMTIISSERYPLKMSMIVPHALITATVTAMLTGVISTANGQGTPPPSGGLKVDESVGKIETALLGAKAIDEAAKQIFSTVTSTLTPSDLSSKKILLYAADQVLNFQAYTTFDAQLSLAEEFLKIAKTAQCADPSPTIPDYSWNMLIRASNPAFSGGRSPVSLEPLSIRLNRLKNRTIEPLINRLPARETIIRRQVDFPVRNSHRFGPFHGPDASSVHYPGAQDTRASLCHNRFQSVAP